FQAEDGIRDFHVTGVQTCALPILHLLPRSGNVLGDNANNVAQDRIGLEGKARGNLGSELLDQLLANLLQGLRDEALGHQAVAHGANTSSASTTAPVSVVTRKLILTLRRAPSTSADRFSIEATPSVSWIAWRKIDSRAGRVIRWPRMRCQ